MKAAPLRPLAWLPLTALLAAAGAADPAAPARRLQVVATTTIVGDVVRAVGGDRIELHVLLPPGADPHAYNAAPRDLVQAAKAEVIFINGAGLEQFLKTLVENAGDRSRIVSVSEGLRLRRLAGAEAAETGGENPGHQHAEGEADPHVWFDPGCVQTWVDHIERTLAGLDPAGAATYAANARRYRDALRELDDWIRRQVAAVPPARRLLVTDHASFGYFADRYGFRQAGVVLPGFSTLAEPSARDLARLEDVIRRDGVRALFVGTTANPALAQRVAQDTGLRVVTLYTGSLGPAGGPAATYLAFMRYNVGVIVGALAEPASKP